MTQWQRRALCARATASLQRLEPQPVRAGVVAQAAPLVFLVFAVVALEDLHVRVALEGEYMRRDAVQDPAVMRDTERRSEEHTSELQSQMSNSYAHFCLKKKKT